MLAYRKSVLALVTLMSPRSVTGLTFYQHFFPSRGQGLSELINGTCLPAYEAFTHRKLAFETYPNLTSWSQRNPGWAVIQCLLDAAPESVKADWSSAQVILGLMPTILGYLGPTSQELSLLLVLGNRQLLALALALGSPFTKCDHSFDFDQEIKILPRLNDEEGSSVLYKWQAGGLFLYFQYLIVFVAIANIAELSYEFALTAPATILQGPPNFLPGLMVIYGFLMHLLVALTFYFRIKIKNGRTDGRNQHPTSYFKTFGRWISQQSSAIDGKSTRYVELGSAKITHTMTSWFAKIAIFWHVAWCIVAFSTVLFVCSEDTIALFVRYFASVCVCRMVAANEIAVLKTIVKRKAKAQSLQTSDSIPQGGKATTDVHVADEASIPLVERGFC